MWPESEKVRAAMFGWALVSLGIGMTIDVPDGLGWGIVVAGLGYLTYVARSIQRHEGGAD